MRRTGFSRKTPARQPSGRQWTGDALPTPRAPALRIADGKARMSVPIEKVPGRVNMTIRKSARGEECQVRLPGVCTRDPSHTIWSHARWGAQLGGAGRSGASKAIDICGAYACTSCDAAYDGQRCVTGMNQLQIDMDWCMAHFRSLAILKQKGLL